MCGRLFLRTNPQLFDRLGAIGGMTFESYNVAPTQDAPIIRRDGNARAVELMRFGFLPIWAKKLGEGAKTINARIETVTEKPAFRRAIETHRCIVLATGFYEWANETREPYAFASPDGEPLLLGGIWARGNVEGREVTSFAILTTAPHPIVRPLHDRTPLLLDQELADRWLDPLALGPADLGLAAERCHSVPLTSWPVGKAVGSPRNNEPSLILPLEAAPADPVPAEARQD